MMAQRRHTRIQMHGPPSTLYYPAERLARAQGRPAEAWCAVGVGLGRELWIR